VKTIIGNLLEIEHGILGHQTNLYHTMGHGIARQIAMKWPKVELEYIDYDGELGDCQLVQVKPGLLVANLFGQDGIGRNCRKTHYGALSLALTRLGRHSGDLDLPVFLPWKMSSDLAGGNWDIVSELIEFLVPAATIVKLPRYDRVTGMPA
jgi:hypothetical protein